MRSWRFALLLTPVGALGVFLGAQGCSQILGFNDYKVTTDGSNFPETGGEAGGDDGGCVGPNGCYACTPTTNDQLQNACTQAQCVPFDEATRIKGYTGKLPDIPDPLDAGTPDGSTTTPDAAALPLCTSLGKPVVYVTGTAKPLVTALGRALFNDPDPVLIAYRGQLSCTGLDQILNGSPNVGTASYWNPASPKTNNEETCALPVPDAGTLFTDIGISDVFADTCVTLSGGLPKDVSDVFGPVQAVAFIVPKASQQKVVSADGAYYVYGLGNQSGTDPWTDEAFIYKRDPTSGTSLSIAPAIGIPPAKWRGVDPGYTAKMLSSVATAAQPEKTIGLAQLINLDQNASLQLNELAFKMRGQSCGYYPDSSSTSKDKKNVRDGHYFLWGPAHFFVKIDPASGQPRDAGVRRILGMLAGTVKPPAGLDLISVESTLNLVPTCAMQVERTRESGPLTPFAPKNACGCYFDQVATGSTSCKTCQIDTDCTEPGRPVCSYGYCEAQ